MTDEYRLLAAKLKQARKLRKLRQVDLADLARVSQMTICNLELARGSLKFECVDKLCALLQVSEVDLIRARLSTMKQKREKV